jgi:hypothetical protein
VKFDWWLKVEHFTNLPTSHRRQYWLLAKRALMREWRDKTTNLARIFAACLLSSILGTLFLRLDYNQADIHSRVGLTFAVLAYWSFGALTALPLTIFERPVFYMQRDQKYYCTSPYLFATILAEVRWQHTPHTPHTHTHTHTHARARHAFFSRSVVRRYQP